MIQNAYNIVVDLKHLLHNAEQNKTQNSPFATYKYTAACCNTGSAPSFRAFLLHFFKASHGDVMAKNKTRHRCPVTSTTSSDLWQNSALG